LILIDRHTLNPLVYMFNTRGISRSSGRSESRYQKRRKRGRGKT